MIYVRLLGGLGNQMFQYALGRHLALKNNTELVLDTTYFDQSPKNKKHFVKRNYDLDVFNIKARMLSPQEADQLPSRNVSTIRKIKHRFKKILSLYDRHDNCRVLTEKTPFSFDEKVLTSGKNTYLIGFWQNEKYFKDIDELIKADFIHVNTCPEKVSMLAREISNSNSVCLNVRRGDFVNNLTHGFVGMGYLFKAVRYIRQAVPFDKIYVFSDEVDWCAENLRLDVPHDFVSHDYAGSKFSSYLGLMARCKHFIIPNSTFGWWAAWLSSNREKIVVAPKRWVNVPGLDATDIIPKGWVTF